MIQTSKLLWGEGLFLRPQHFQRQDAYHEWRLADTARLLNPYAWGIRKIQVDTDALTTGILRFSELQLVLPDGDLFSAPQDAELPSPVNLSMIPAGVSEVVFHAAIAPMRPNGANFSLPNNGETGLRYVSHNTISADWYTNAAEAEITTLQQRLKILADSESRDHLTSLPLCNVRRTASGVFELDTRYIPPSTSIRASPALKVILRRLLDALQAKVDALYGLHREPSKHIIEFRSGDIASFWLLHTASSAFAALSHIHHNPDFHPERLYERLLELAGALMTFSRSYSLGDLPAYTHFDPGPAFIKLDLIIRELLETVISTRYFSIALQEIKPSFYHGKLDAERITSSTSLYLAVQAAMQPAELVETVPLRFKVGAPDDVDKLVMSAIGGVRVVHAPQVPAAIPVRPGAYYFSIEARGPLYERMLQGQIATIYVPSGIPDLHLELFALNQ